MSRTVQSPTDSYQVLRSLGSGATASTWLGQSKRTGKPVVLKELRLTDADGWEAVALFEREAEVLRGLDHEAVPRLIESFRSSDSAVYTLVLSWVDGTSLRERMDAQPGTGAEVATLLRQGLELLVWLQARVPPVIHRDITPRNVLVSDGPQGLRLRLVDFGAVKTAVGANPGASSETVGTFGYMAPEQLTGQADPRSDLYGLGMTLVAFALGRDALDLPRTRHGRVRLWRLTGRLPAAVRATLRAMTELEPAKRPANAAAALVLLQQGPPRGPMIARLAAALTLVTCVSGYVATRIPSPGEIATLGGWFSGHGRFWPAIGATFAAKPDFSVAASRVVQLGFSPDGANLASATDDGELIMWSIPAGTERWRVQDPQLREPKWVAVRAYGTVLVAASGRLVTVSAGAIVGATQVEGHVLAGTLCATGAATGAATLLLHRSGGLVVASVTPTETRVQASRAGIAKPWHAAISPNGQRVSWVDEVEGAQLWQVSDPSVTTLVAGGQPQAVALTDDAAMVSSFRYLWWMTAGDMAKVEDFSNMADVVAIAPDGKHAAISPLYASKVAVLHDTSGPISARLPQRGRVRALAFSPDGAMLAVGGEDQRVKLWRVGATAPP